MKDRVLGPFFCVPLFLDFVHGFISKGISVFYGKFCWVEGNQIIEHRLVY